MPRKIEGRKHGIVHGCVECFSAGGAQSLDSYKMSIEYGSVEAPPDLTIKKTDLRGIAQDLVLSQKKGKCGKKDCKC
tara:strand:+ start:1613 stop:1843 length:231 start_codon:yes stop_codon:yes gene_type:complete